MRSTPQFGYGACWNIHRVDIMQLFLFMEVHEHLPEGATAKDVTRATPPMSGPTTRLGQLPRYWDEQAGKVFCPVEAPDAETAIRDHQGTERLVTDRVYPVREGS